MPSSSSELTAGSVGQHLLGQLDATIVHIQQQVRLAIRSLGSDDRVVPLHAQEKEGPEKGLVLLVCGGLHPGHPRTTPS